MRDRRLSTVDGNLPFGSKLHVIPGFESSNLCTISQVLARDGSVLPRVEEKRAQADEAFCTATPALIFFWWNSQPRGPARIAL